MDKAIQFFSRLPVSILAALFAVSVALCASCKSESSSVSNAVSNTTSKSEERVDEQESDIVAGSIAPDFTLPGLDGQKHSLSSYRGKTVLLNFWATWCVPCVAEMPALERLYQLYKDKGLEIVAVSVDTEESNNDVMEFVKKNGITFKILRDTDISIPSNYGVTGFPESFFIGPDGKVLEFNDPETKSKIARIVSERAWDAEAVTKTVSALLVK